jgi:hypothetical protein
MRRTVLSMPLLAVSIAATFALTGIAHAQNTYSGARIWDAGPYTVWQGVDADDTSLQIMAVIGETSSMSITYPTGSAPSLQYLIDRVELTAGISKKLQPIDPAWNDFIMKCEMNGGNIWCYCTPLTGASCSQGGIVTGTPNHTWLNIQYVP